MKRAFPDLLPADHLSRSGGSEPRDSDAPLNSLPSFGKASVSFSMDSPFPPSKRKHNVEHGSPQDKLASCSFTPSSLPVLGRSPYQPTRLDSRGLISSPGPHHTSDVSGHDRLEEAPLLPLTKSYLSRHGSLELVIKRQPRGHHRARYEKEGSRGSIKDASGNPCPAVQLKGLKSLKGERCTSVLQVFVVAQSDRICPHPLYRIHRVYGKNCISCHEREIDDTSIIEMDVGNDNDDGVINLNCMGITKLRNADLETDTHRMPRRALRDPNIHLVFRTITSFRGPDGFFERTVLQVCSEPICCTSSAGLPEILQLSHEQWPVSGGLRVIILGRNFLKDQGKVIVQETNGKEDEEVIWQRELLIQRENFLTVHLVALMVPYHNLLVSGPVQCQLIMVQKGLASEPYNFTYVPVVQPVWSQLQSQILQSPLLREALCTSPPNEAPMDTASACSRSPSPTLLPQPSIENIRDEKPYRRAQFWQETPPPFIHRAFLERQDGVGANFPDRNDLRHFYTGQQLALEGIVPGSEIVARKYLHANLDEEDLHGSDLAGTETFARDDWLMDDYLKSLGSVDKVAAAKALLTDLLDEILK